MQNKSENKNKELEEKKKIPKFENQIDNKSNKITKPLVLFIIIYETLV